MAKKDELTDKQSKFAQFVAEGDTYADAYRKSYSVKNMAIKTIWENSSRLMANSKVKARVEQINSNTIKRNEVTIDEVLNELANWIRFDPLMIIDPDTECVKMLKDMDKEARMSIAEIHVQELFDNVPNIDGKKIRTKIGEIKKIKFVDKRATAEMFMKKFGQYVEQNNGIADNLDAIKEIIEAVKK